MSGISDAQPELTSSRDAAAICSFLLRCRFALRTNGTSGVLLTVTRTGKSFTLAVSYAVNPLFCLSRVQMDLPMAGCAQRDEIFLCIVTETTAWSHVVNLEIRDCPTVLAAPSVSL